MIKIWSTLSEQKEPLPERRPLRLFVCGPTVYDYPHIGNARTFMAFDLLVKYLRSCGVEVFYLQNITDVDDKIITRAAEDGSDWKTVARKFEKIYYQNLKALGINSVNKYARATDYIKEIVRQAKTLKEKGHVYEIPGDGWYFDLTTFPDYGRLAHRTVDQAEDAISRVDESKDKRNKGDFCVWKFSRPGEPSWNTELGAGRPGWHIEDTAITEHFFGAQYDIHGGAIDLKFPHHEAEIAQQESASGKKPLVKIWMHAGFLFVGGEKMSKSKGNFITIDGLLQKYSAEIFRMAALSRHYRSPLDWTDEVAEQASKNLAELKMFIGRLEFLASKGAGTRILGTKKFADDFIAAMEDDFNTPQALAALFTMMNEANQDFWSISPASAKDMAEFLRRSLGSFGFGLKSPGISWKVSRLAAKREKSRQNKQFMQSDALRAEIEKLGYRNEDTPLGPFVWPNA